MRSGVSQTSGRLDDVRRPSAGSGSRTSPTASPRCRPPASRAACPSAARSARCRARCSRRDCSRRRARCSRTRRDCPARPAPPRILTRERRALGVPRGLFVAASTARGPAGRSPSPDTPPRIRHRRPPCGRSPAGLPSRPRALVSRGIPRNVRDAVAHAVRLHVVRVDRHLTVRRIGHRVRRTERRVPLERDVVFGFDDLRGAREAPRRDCRRRSGCALDVGVAPRM